MAEINIPQQFVTKKNNSVLLKYKKRYAKLLRRLSKEKLMVYVII